MTLASEREFTPARREQGFRSQADLDAFYAYYDHTRQCAGCQRPGPACWLEGSASWQPTSNVCAAGRELQRGWDRLRAAEGGDPR